MSLAWHIARKDLFRLRIVLLLWAAVLTGQMGLATIQSNLDAAGYFPFLIGSWVFGNIFLPLLVFGLVMSAQHDDSVCDTDAFWITRPISGGLLLRAKVIVWVILGLFPSLIVAPWWLAHGYDTGQIAGAVAHTLRWQLSVTLLALPLAVLSASNGRFVMYAFLAAAIFVGLIFASDILASEHVYGASPLDGAARSQVMAVAWFIGAGAILAHQYRTRRTIRSLYLAVAAAVIGFAAGLFMSSPVPPSPHADTGQLPAGTLHPQLAAVLDPDVGSAFVRHGFRLRVTESVPLYPQNWIMSVNESSPDFTYPAWIKTTASPEPAGNEFYFLVSRSDGRSVRATIGHTSQTLTEGALLVGTLRYFRRELTFSMPAWTRDSTDNFKAWVMNANLVKVIAAGDLKEFPHDAWPKAVPLSP